MRMPSSCSIAWETDCCVISRSSPRSVPSIVRRYLSFSPTVIANRNTNIAISYDFVKGSPILGDLRVKMGDESVKMTDAPPKMTDAPPKMSQGSVKIGERPVKMTDRSLKMTESQVKRGGKSANLSGPAVILG